MPLGPVRRPLCDLCGNFAEDLQTLYSPETGSPRTMSRVTCRTCGTYDISAMLSESIQSFPREKRYRLSAITRSASERGEMRELTTDSAAHLLETIPQPSPPEQMDLVLEYLAARAGAGNLPVPFDPKTDYAIAFASGMDGLNFLTKSLQKKGLVVRTDQSALPHYQVLMAGYEHLEERKAARRRAVGTTGWPKVDRAMEEIRKRLEEATTEEQFAAVCHLCGQTLISLAEAVYSPARHRIADGTEVSPTDAKRRLDAFLAVEMGGSSRGEERRIARAAIEFALETVKSADSAKHDRNADRRLALYCAAATALVVRLVEIAAGKQDRR